tara:strand:+ start:49 stop:354 length:306 start_codon:yes stop_codon:yes gene_type:complete
MSNMHDSPSTYNDFQKRGIPGEYYGMQIFSGSAAENPDVYYTGSKFGAAAFIVGTGSATIHPVGGGAINATQLTVGTLYPISVHRITGGSSAYIYVLKKNG